MVSREKIELAKERFGQLLEEQLKRVENMKAQGDFIDYKSLDQIIIGVCGGDGIGPAITAQAERVLKYLLKDDVASGRIVFRNIEGLTIERRAEENAAIMAVLEEIKKCHVIQNALPQHQEKGILGQM